MKKTLLIIFVVASTFAASSAYAQINREWVHRHNGTADSYDIVCDIIPDDSGNVFVYGTSFNTGTATDITMIKYSSSGSIVAEKKFNFGVNSYDRMNAVYKDNLNNSYICGFTNEGGSDNKMVTLKTDANGNLVWSKIFTKVNYSNFLANDITVYNDRVYVTGNGRNSQGYNEMFLICYNINGTFQWEKNLESPQTNIEGVNLVVNSTNRIHVACNYTYTNNNTIFGVATYDLTGNYIDNIQFGETRRVIKLITDNSKNLICLSTFVENGNIDFAVNKADSISVLNHAWFRTFNGSGNHFDYPFDVCVDSQNNVLVTGSSRHGDSLGTEDIVTLKYSPTGDLLWSRIYNSDSNGIDQGMSITTDANNNVYVGGASDLGGVRLGYKILKYSPSGNLLWQDGYSHAHHPEDFVYSVKVNKQNDLFVTGISFNPGTDYDMTTIKYSQNTSIENISSNIPDKFYLSQNYPNPFNGISNIEFSISNLADISLKVFNISGQELEILHKGILSAGSYKVQWDSKNLPSGIYFYELKANNFREVKKMILVK